MSPRAKVSAPAANVPKAQPQDVVPRWDEDPAGDHAAVRATYKQGRESTAAMQDELDHIDTSNQASDALWNLIDKDGSGSISRQEFAKMYAVLRGHVVNEHEQTRSLKSEAAKAKRRSQQLFAAVGVLLFVCLLLLFGNMGLTYWVMELTRTLHSTNQGGSQNATFSMLVDTSDAPVATGTITESFSLTFLPMRFDEIDYNQIKKIKLPVGEEVVGFSVIGFRWFNRMSMDLYLATGLTLHLDSGYMAVTPTNDTTFAPASSSWLNATLTERRRMFEEDAFNFRSELLITGRPSRQLVRRPETLPHCGDGFGNYEVCVATGDVEVDTGVNVKPGSTGGLDVHDVHPGNGPWYPGYDWGDGYIRICGNYCGPGWCAGEWKPEHECYEDGDLEQGEPSGPADACCKAHDECCGGPDREFGNCNEVLSNCVRAVLDERDGVFSADPGCSKAMQWLIVEYMWHTRDRVCGGPLPSPKPPPAASAPPSPTPMYHGR